MIGVSISRWTMSYFAAALVALIVAEILMLAGFGYPSAAIRSGETLILVHVVAIGWLSLLMCGALLQFLPVLVAEPLYSDRLALPALLMLVAGLAALILGFLQTGGSVSAEFPFMACAALLLVAGFALILWNIARTIVAAKATPLPARFVIAGLASLAATVALGAIFALVLGGATDSAPLVALTGTGLPIHVIAGLCGWLTFSAMGVSYRLLAMFMLAPEPEGRSAHAALLFGAAGLAIAIAGGIVAILMRWSLLPALLASLVPGGLALILYGADVIHLYRARKRRKFELNSSMAALALASFAASVVLALILLAIGRFGEHVGSVVFLAAFGWLTGLGLAQLYKIVAFLTWLECYGPVLGKAVTPRVQDLVTEPRARRWFLVHFAGAFGGTAALLVDFVPGYRISAALLLVASLGIAAELIRTRRLLNVEKGARLPQGVQRPFLLLSRQS